MNQRLHTFGATMLAVLFTALLQGCGGGGGVAPQNNTSGSQSAISVSASASATTLAPGQQTTLTAVVSNDSASAGVTFSLASGAPGTLTKVDSLHATYTAPASVGSSTSIVVTATSVTNNGKSATITLTVQPPPSVAVTSPQSAVGPNQTLTLTASVTNDINNAGVSWSMPSGSPGTLTATDALHATYTAPSSITATAQVVITAASKVDSSQTSTFTVNLQPTLTVTAQASILDFGPQQVVTLTADVANDVNAQGVQWSVSGGAPGTLTTTDALHATYSAPAIASQSTTFTVTATSVADTTKSANLQLTLHPVTITVSGTPSSALYPLQSAQLSATVAYDTNKQGVTWTVAPTGQGVVASVDTLDGVYTAPASIAQNGSVTLVATSVLDPSVSSSPVTINYQPTTTAYWQNLVQFENGLVRGSSKPYSLLALNGGNGTVPTQWQPDMVIFHDTQNGTEIWRMSNDPSDTYIPGVINRTPWNANGSYIILGSTRNPNQNPYGMTDDWLYDARGGLQVPFMPFDPNRQPAWTQNLANGNGFLPPDRTDPNIVYTVSYDDNNQGQWPDYHSFIYAINLAPNQDGRRFQETAVAEIPNVTDPVTGVQSATIRTELRAQLADDDRILVNDFNDSSQPASNDPGGWPKFHLFDGSQVDSVVAANLNSDPRNLPKQLPVLDTYSIHFDLTNDVPCPAGASDTNPAAPCHDVNQEWHLHDFYFQRDADDHIELNYGPRGDVGEYVDFTVPSLYNGDNTTIALAYPNGLTPYFSHPGFSDGHKMAVYLGEDVLGSNNYGVWVRDLTTGLPIRQIEKNPPFDSGHSDWSGFDQNYFVFDGWTSQVNHEYDLYEGLSSATANFASTGKPDRILVHYPPRDPNNTVSILYSPTQSPDATKVAFTIPDSFDPSLNAHQTTFIAVSHRPAPPTLSVTGTAPVTLSWVPYSPHFEVKGYHVYRAGSASPSSFTEISNGLITATTFTDSTAQNGQTYLYAVTAEEYSGLESNQFSNIMQVTVGGSSSQTAAAGTTGWDTSAPNPPTGASVSQIAPNVWKVTWTPSTASDVRYYNVYVSMGTAPQATQAYLVDSPPLGQTSYIYWQGDPSIAPVFGVTAMDRQDNQSTMACVAAQAGSNACGGQ